MMQDVICKGAMGAGQETEYAHIFPRGRLRANFSPWTELSKSQLAKLKRSAYQPRMTYIPHALRLTAFALSTALMLSACAPASDAPLATKTTVASAGMPSLKTALTCLPDGAALMASHRGTSRDWDIAENGLAGLKQLIADGYKVAEIDIAGLKDGTLITYHDGVWDETSTGKGPVASSTAGDVEKILLKTRKGTLTAERPPLFADLLAAGKGKIYFEIDFKSSAKKPAVIQAIRDAGMTDQVVLIAYNPEQQATLEKLAPDMLLSTPTETSKAGHLVWMGPDAWNSAEAEPLIAQGSIVIGRVWERAKADKLGGVLQNSRMVVTDYINQYDPIMGLKPADMPAYEACLKTG